MKFNYQNASDLDLAKHLLSSFKRMSGEQIERIDFSYYEKSNDCGTYRCAAGWMAYWDEIPIYEDLINPDIKRECLYLTDEFVCIFLSGGIFDKMIKRYHTDLFRSWVHFFGDESIQHKSMQDDLDIKIDRATKLVRLVQRNIESRVT